jgi:hypothetical protein
VTAIAAAWTGDNDPVCPGEFVATIGFTSADHLTVDLAITISVWLPFRCSTIRPRRGYGPSSPKPSP